jgi:putative transposase
MIDRSHELSLTRQAAVLKLSRSGLYYRPRPVAPADLAVMRRIDELHLDYPFAGSRMLRDLLRGEGVAIGRQRVSTMMKRMGITAIYRRPNTSKPGPGHKIYPYLLRCVAVERPNQAWAMDITYIPMARGFVYLAAVVDLVQPPGPGLAALDHDGGRVLPRGGRGGAGEARQARDFQHGPRKPIHQRRVHRCAADEGDRHQHGRQGIVAGQRLRRTALALDQI